MGEWISVNDQRPVDGGPYLTYSPTAYMRQTVRAWLPTEESWEHEWLTKRRSEHKPKTWITHWMPLPEPPHDLTISEALSELQDQIIRPGPDFAIKAALVAALGDGK